MSNALAVHTRRWAIAFVERGHDVHVLSIRHTEIPGVKVHTVRVGPVNSASLLWSFLSYLRLLFSARRRLRKMRPDILQAPYYSSLTTTLAADHSSINNATPVSGSLILIWPELFFIAENEFKDMKISRGKRRRLSWIGVV